MEEAPEHGEESSHSAHADGTYRWMNTECYWPRWCTDNVTTQTANQQQNPPSRHKTYVQVPCKIMVLQEMRQ